ncbi:excalibur calcium-binding domain-containing protein [Amphritea japonica]|uniref:Cold shock protein n=1 Tax=Amphritea japonica ATCC BAA-1530 TaxID=1278309 RepID=A0A7R6SRV5_9GAMM|nr:excalibur calcium-binding domain-containing protein [Amphritea japonica]BBB25570.1 cold shock protein [Amphritea japonica ATCC BAA-1530]
MKKLILIVLIGYGAWNYYTTNVVSPNVSYTSYEYDKQVKRAKAQPQSNYRCDGRQHCSQMGSLAEAEFFLRNCPNTKMDGDHDGKPCERQFGGY